MRGPIFSTSGYWGEGTFARRRYLCFSYVVRQLQLIGGREEAIALALRLLTIDPLQEDVDRALMRLYSDQGQTALAFGNTSAVGRSCAKSSMSSLIRKRGAYQELLRDRSQPPCRPGICPPLSRRLRRGRSGRPFGFVPLSDGVRIAYASVGEGPPLVKAANWLNHLEFDFASPVWQHWIEALSRNHTFLRYDERGTDLSDWDVFDISFDAFVRDLEPSSMPRGSIVFPCLVLPGLRHLDRLRREAPGTCQPSRPLRRIRQGLAPSGRSAKRPAGSASTLVLEGWGQETRCFGRYSRPSSSQMPCRTGPVV